MPVWFAAFLSIFRLKKYSFCNCEVKKIAKWKYSSFKRILNPEPCACVVLSSSSQVVGKAWKSSWRTDQWVTWYIALAMLTEQIDWCSQERLALFYLIGKAHTKELDSRWEVKATQGFFKLSITWPKINMQQDKVWWCWRRAPWNKCQ